MWLEYQKWKCINFKVRQHTEDFEISQRLKCQLQESYLVKKYFILIPFFGRSSFIAFIRMETIIKKWKLDIWIKNWRFNIGWNTIKWKNKPPKI